MLGSAIPKRWIMSLALVGLVFLFVASYSAVWASPASAGTTTTASAPPSITAVVGDGQATVSWTAPSDDGHNHLSGYTVTSSPGGLTLVTVSTSVVFTGLTNGTPYTFTVVATNNVGNSIASSTSNSVTPFAVAAGSVLTTLVVASSLDLASGQATDIVASPRDPLGNEDLTMPSVVYTWNAGSCGTLSSTTSRTPTFTAGTSACTGTITVHARQADGSNVPSPDHSITVNVAAPLLPPPPPPPPVDPVDIPDLAVFVERLADLGFVLSIDAVLEIVTPASGGKVTLAPPVGAEPDAAPIEIDIPVGAIDDDSFAAVTVSQITAADVPPPPPPATEGSSSATFKFGSTIISIDWFDSAGAAIGSQRLNKPAKICVPFNAADVAGADGGPSGMAIWRYNGTEWVELNSTVNISDGTVCANTASFSSFALGLSVAAPDADAATPDTGLPATGGYTPGVVSLIIAMLAGIALVGTGAFTARRSRRAREDS